MKTKFIIIFLFLFFLIPQAKASDFKAGISIGPAIGFNTDFNQEHSKTKTHLGIGLDTFYSVPCYQGKLCKNIDVHFYFDYVLGTSYNFGLTTLRSTSTTGQFSEKLSFISGGLGLYKYLPLNKKFQAVGAIDLGMEYIRVSSVSFRSVTGAPLSLSLKQSSYHFAVNPGIGFVYKLSDRMQISFVPTFHLPIPTMLNAAFVELPLGIQLSL